MCMSLVFTSLNLRFLLSQKGLLLFTAAFPHAGAKGAHSGKGRASADSHTQPVRPAALGSLAPLGTTGPVLAQPFGTPPCIVLWMAANWVTVAS